MKTIMLTATLTLIASAAVAQTSQSIPSSTSDHAGETEPATATGHDIGAGVAGYTYREPGVHAISIHGDKLTLEYTGTASLNKRQHWFVQAQVRSTLGSGAYQGWCSPYLITPNRASPNGYELGIGGASPCRESGDSDWYVEGRGLVGKDVIGQRWGWSPYSGLGLRHLSNGTNGVSGYRSDDYLYVPLGLTARTAVASRKTLSLTVEVDALLHGWQRTRDSELGGGDFPATTTAPPFTINGFTDVSFSQSRGWALRASAQFPLTVRWSLQPYYVRWSVRASPVNDETVTFTVNNVRAQEQLGFYEPYNVTNEVGVRLGIHF